MAGLVAVWVGIGLLMGLLAHPARLWPTAWGQRSWLWLIGLGIAGALTGALVAVLLFSLLIATAAALLLAVIVVAAVPWALARRDARSHAAQQQ